jgi:hypothetical protein
MDPTSEKKDPKFTDPTSEETGSVWLLIRTLEKPDTVTGITGTSRIPNPT